MKLRRATLVVAAMLLGAVVAADALAARGGGRSGGRGGGHGGSHSGHVGAHRGHHAGGHFVPRFRTSVFIGAPLIAPFYFYPPPPPYFHYPEPVLAPSAPAYIEQHPGQIAPQQPSYWYYCPSSNAYYPYVKECPEAWQQVIPQPPS